MNPVTRSQKLYFLAVGLLALWVGVWGFFIPAQVDKAIPWLVPPLHARFIGAIYIAGTIMMALACTARTYRAVHVPAILSVVWTGSLFIISLFYLDEFDFTRGPVWFWFAAYIAYPIIGTWIVWRNRESQDTSPGPIMAEWLRTTLFIEGVVLTALALALLLFPDFMLILWPWNVTRLLIQIYSGPFLAFGLAAFLASRERTWNSIRIMVLGIFTLAFGSLLASSLHLSLFSFASPSAWVWFGGFLLLLALHAAMILSNRSPLRKPQ